MYQIVLTVTFIKCTILFPTFHIYNEKAVWLKHISGWCLNMNMFCWLLKKHVRNVIFFCFPYHEWLLRFLSQTVSRFIWWTQSCEILKGHKSVHKQQLFFSCAASGSSGGGASGADVSLYSDTEPLEVDKSLLHTRSAAFPSIKDTSVTVFSLSDISPSSSSSMSTNSLR